MQSVRIRLAAGDLSDLFLRHLGGQDEDRLGQRDLLATFIVNEPWLQAVMRVLRRPGWALSISCNTNKAAGLSFTDCSRG